VAGQERERITEESDTAASNIYYWWMLNTMELNYIWDFKTTRASVGAGMEGLILSYLTTPLSFSSLWTAIPAAIGPATDINLPHSRAIPLSFFYFGPPTQLPLAWFLAYRPSFPIGQSSPLDSYITAVLSR
jgi:hypothetical protein